MYSPLKKLGKKIYRPVKDFLVGNNEKQLLALGSLLCNQQKTMTSTCLTDYEFKIFSQRGEDGIIQHLIRHVPIKNRTFIEFGVETYVESNTRFLMMNNNWNGLIMDGSEENMESVRQSSWFWMYDLIAKSAFIDAENINRLIAEHGLTDIGLLSIDIDGNDYWVLQALDLSVLNPSILVLEYNALFGIDRTISIPYEKNFHRTTAHYSNLYFGASLRALTDLAAEKGYAFVGCNLGGSNAFYVKKKFVTDKLPSVSIAEGFRPDKCRQSRNPDYTLSYLRGEDRLAAIRGLKVINVNTGEVEHL
jgi:hypothetical protein